MNSRTFQFSLLTFLVGSTIAAVLISAIVKICWFGLLEIGYVGLTSFTAIAVTAVCIRSRCYALAYLAAAFACGQLFYCIASLPFSIIAFALMWDSPPIPTSFYFGCSSLITSFALRVWWRGEDRPMLYRGLVLSYTCPAVFMLVANFGHSWLGIPSGEPPTMSFSCLFGLWYLTTISIYVVLPAWLLTAALLGSVDEHEYDWINELRGFGAGA